MTSETPAAASAAASQSHTVTISGEPRTVERISGLKMARALAIIKAAGDAVPKIASAWGEYRTEYERTHFVELPRATALMQYGPRAVLDKDGSPMLDETGQVRMGPGALAHMTEQDWEASGHVLRLPESPSFYETVPAVLPQVLEVAEEHVYRLLALFLIPNAELLALWKGGSWQRVLEERTDELLAAAYGDELIELAVVCGEVVDDQFRRRVEALGGRLGNALRLFGLDPTTMMDSSPQTTEQATQTTRTTGSPTSDEPGTSSPPNLSTDSPTATGGESPTPSTPQPTSSTPSTPSPSETASAPPQLRDTVTA